MILGLYTVCYSEAVRTVSPAIQDNAEKRITEIAQAYQAQVAVMYQRRYPATINHCHQADIAMQAAKSVVEKDKVIIDPKPCLGSENVSFMPYKSWVLIFSWVPVWTCMFTIPAIILMMKY